MAKTNSNLNILIPKELSIQISLSGLSFCVLNKDTNTITYIKHHQAQKKQTPDEVLDTLLHLFNTETELQEQFNTVHVSHVNELSTIVPKSLFKEDALVDYLKFNSKILKSDFITYDHIEINDSVNVYVPYVNINNYLYEKFGSFVFKHYSSILIEQILHLEKNANDSKLYIHIDTYHFEIIVTKNGELQLYNTFEYSAKEDFIYYILFTIEQLELNPETINTILLGDVSKDDELYAIAYKYIRHISFGNRYDNYTYSQNPKSSYSNFTLIKNF